MKTEHDVLSQFANKITERILRKVIFALRKTDCTLSSEDSNLKNAWEEICVQIQLEHSWYWEHYDETANSLIYQEAKKLKKHEAFAIWFQTDEGQEWEYTPRTSWEHYESLNEEERSSVLHEDDEPPVLVDDVVEYIKRCLFEEADKYKNKRISSYLGEDF